MNTKSFEKKFFITICLFFFNLLLPNIFSLLSLQCPLIVQLLLSVTVMIIFIAIYKDDFRDSLKDFAKKPFKYIGIALLAFVIYFVSNILINSAISYGFNTSVPNNTSSDLLYKSNPIYFIFLTLCISPVIESSFIPMSFYKILKNKTFYYLICSILYGTLYVVFSLKTPLQLLYIISYAILGFIISYLYDRYKNILLPILIKIISGVLFLLTYIM